MKSKVKTDKEHNRDLQARWEQGERSGKKLSKRLDHKQADELRENTCLNGPELAPRKEEMGGVRARLNH